MDKIENIFEKPYLDSLKFWRKNGGIVVKNEFECGNYVLVEEEDDLKLRKENNIYLALKNPEINIPDLKNLILPIEKILYANSNKKKGIQSWGDWEIEVSRVSKKYCPTVISYVIHNLACNNWNETYCSLFFNSIKGIGERLCYLIDGDSWMTYTEPSWDYVLSKMADNLTLHKIKAQDCILLYVWKWEECGNVRIYIVETDKYFYRCSMITS